MDACGVMSVCSLACGATCAVSVLVPDGCSRISKVVERLIGEASSISPTEENISDGSYVRTVLDKASKAMTISMVMRGAKLYFTVPFLVNCVLVPMVATWIILGLSLLDGRMGESFNALFAYCYLAMAVIPAATLMTIKGAADTLAEMRLAYARIGDFSRKLADGELDAKQG